MLKRDFIKLLFIPMPVAMARKQKLSQPLTGADLLIYRECNLLSVRAAFRIFITFRISLLQPAVYCSVPILHRTTSAGFPYPLLTPSLTAKQIITRRLSASHKPPVCQTTTLTAFPPPGGWGRGKKLYKCDRQGRWLSLMLSFHVVMLWLNSVGSSSINKVLRRSAVCSPFPNLSEWLSVCVCSARSECCLGVETPLEFC